MNETNGKKERDRQIDRMLLDPKYARATPPQRKALNILIETGMQEDAALIEQTMATLTIHRHILTQLVAAAIGRGFNMPLTGPVRSKMAEEAYAIMRASELFSRDVMAAQNIHPEAADAIITAYEAAQGISHEQEESEERSLALVPDAPDLDDMTVARRVAFDAEGKIVNAPVTGGSDSGEAPE